MGRAVRNRGFKITAQSHAQLLESHSLGHLRELTEETSLLFEFRLSRTDGH